MEAEIKQAAGGKSIGIGEQKAFPMLWGLDKATGRLRNPDKVLKSPGEGTKSPSNPQKYGIIGDV